MLVLLLWPFLATVYRFRLQSHACGLRCTCRKHASIGLHGLSIIKRISVFRTQESNQQICCLHDSKESRTCAKDFKCSQRQMGMRMTVKDSPFCSSCKLEFIRTLDFPICSTIESLAPNAVLFALEHISWNLSNPRDAQSL